MGGADLGTISLRAFWGADGRVFDPRIIYDPLDARWIATADMNARLAESAVLLAMSHTADPTQGWDIYQFPADRRPHREVCPAFADDRGGVTVSQLVRGVTNSLAGCP